jgi:undecaprenyl diphosphate synthase
MNKGIDLIIPKHIGIILDGNRRYAEKIGESKLKGHEYGAKKVNDLIDWCIEYEIKEITLYTFSTENFNRPKIEVVFLMKLFEKYFSKVKKELKYYDDFKIKFVGNKSLFSKEIQNIILDLEEMTKNNSKLIVNFLFGYGGRDEIINATKKTVKQVLDEGLDINSIDEEQFSKNLYLNSDLDLLIRTSEQRLSGFLTWQSVYSEIIFLPNILWPEFDKSDFIFCLEEYSKRKRRFGK